MRQAVVVEVREQAEAAGPAVTHRQAPLWTNAIRSRECGE
jgi:hypothetical protein